MTPYVRLLVGCLVGRMDGQSVCHNFQIERGVTLPCFYRETCYIFLPDENQGTAEVSEKENQEKVDLTLDSLD